MNRDQYLTQARELHQAGMSALNELHTAGNMPTDVAVAKTAHARACFAGARSALALATAGQ